MVKIEDNEKQQGALQQALEDLRRKFDVTQSQLTTRENEIQVRDSGTQHSIKFIEVY
jgi:hypothetical protein